VIYGYDLHLLVDDDPQVITEADIDHWLDLSEEDQEYLNGINDEPEECCGGRSWSCRCNESCW
jgi:hypothetical protein